MLALAATLFFAFSLVDDLLFVLEVLETAADFFFTALIFSSAIFRKVTGIDNDDLAGVEEDFFFSSFLAKDLTVSLDFGVAMVN